MIRSLGSGLLLALCTACAAGPLMPRSDAADADAAPARLVVYWPADSQPARLADRPEVVLNNYRIGHFAPGGEVSRGDLRPGVYRVAIRRPASNAPSKDLGTFDLPLEPGKTLYVRYSDEPTGAMPAPLETVTARVRIAVVDEETGAARR